MTREPHQTVEVAVVGAGPAGAAAATTLARRGASVLLVDKALFPRDKTCGDGLTTGALRRLASLGLDSSLVASFLPVGEIAVRSPSGRTAFLPFRTDQGVFAAVARRRDLDSALVDLARQVGVEVVEGTRCTGLDYEPDRVRLGFADGSSVDARHVVAADGAWSEIRKLVEQRAPRPEGTSARPDWLAQRTYVTGARPDALDRMWVWFARSLLPGYAWSFPVGDATLNVGVAIASSSGRELAGAWKAVLASPFLASLVGDDAVLDGSGRAWPIPTRLEPEMLSALGGAVMFVGDAAGAADPFTGEGIAQALETGVSAAEAILDGGTDHTKVADTYRQAVLATLGRDHRLATFCQRLFSHPVGARGVVRVVDSGDFMRRNVGRWLFEDYPRTVLATPKRWQSVFRRDAGPFADGPSG